MRPFPTQLSATPPAMVSCFSPVISCAYRVMRSMTSSVTAWIDAAMSISRWVMGVSAFRGGPSRIEFIRLDVMTSLWQYAK